MSPGARSQAVTYVKIVGRRIAVKAVTFSGVKEPRLRFDRVAVGFITRLQAALSKSVPDGKTLVVTITAPIWKDSKTREVLEGKIRELLAASRARLEATINGNRIRVRVLEGGTRQTSKLVGFVHNPEPDPEMLFDVTSFLLTCIGSGKRHPARDRWLVVANQNGLVPAKTVRQVCLALHARTVCKRIFVAEGEGVRALSAFAK